MLIHIPGVLSPELLQQCRETLMGTDWSDGRGSAGYLSAQVKDNQQLPDLHPVGQELGKLVLRALSDNQQFIAAALPLKILPPLFNRYEAGQEYGRHVDGAMRSISGTPYRLRTDLSATLFLNDPANYDGGELEIQDTYGVRQVKLDAGDLVLYPGTSVHRVLPVTRGIRLASFFWIQSMVREDARRTVLFELDKAIQKVATDSPQQAALTDLAGVYHNLLRFWADS